MPIQPEGLEAARITPTFDLRFPAGTRIYLSGPMTGQPDHGYPAFRAYAAKLRDLGYTVTDPSENFGGDPGHARAEYMRADVGHLLDAQAVAVLPGWEKSSGARLEVSIARELGLPVVDADTLYPVPRGDDRFHALIGEIAALHDRKQSDYGRDADPFANVRAAEEWGVPPWVGACIRLNDKVRRLQAYARRGFLANEGAEDSLMDIAVYALIALVLMRENNAAKAAPA